MNPQQVLAMRKAFKTVKERQDNNKMNNIEEKKKRLKAVRELCVCNQVLLEKTIQNVKKNGINVQLVKDKQDAVEVVKKEIGTEKLVVKSKSNVTKEIELTKNLEKMGIEVIETDIGDRILQLLHLTPSHPTGPIAHVSAREISEGFRRMGIQMSDSPEEIVKYIKEDVVNNLKKAKIGITGANAITAEEGSIIMTHNEGNIFEVMRKEKHIVLTSIDKIYPSIEDALSMLKILSYNATGATIPSFVEIISGVSKTADVEKKFFKGVHAPNEITLIIIDNKRSEIAEKGYRELLYCIGCGNCLIHCPMYNTVGNAYGKDNFLGGKGLAYYALSNSGIENLDHCLTCGKCRQNCPVEIDLPGIIREIRGKDVYSDVYYFIKSHIFWAYYNMILGKSYIEHYIK